MAKALTESHSKIMRIEPSPGWVSLKLHELWEYRELLYFLTWRDIKIRYKQTAFGATWAILQPLFTTLIFSLFFGKLAKMPSEGIPYPLFTFTALVPWTLFANSLSQSSNSIVSNSNLITKVYFPRLANPISTVLAVLVDFAIAFVILQCMCFYYGILPTARYFFLPLFILLSITTSLGIGLWLSALNVQFRDVRHAVPFLVQVWLFASPIVYPSSLLPEPWRTLYGLNPMAGVVEGFRWALLNTSNAPGPMIIISASMSVLLLIGGAFYFRRMEKTFADIV